MTSIKARMGIAVVVLLVTVPIACGQDTRRPFSIERFLTVYSTFQEARGGTLSEEDRDLFVKSVVNRHGIGFAPTPGLRKRLAERGVEASLIASLCNEVSRGRGIGVYVFSFMANDDDVGKEFARLVHTEVELQKPRILEIVDRKEFLPGATDYGKWKEEVSQIYAFYVTGDITNASGETKIIAKIRFRPAKTKSDSTVEVPPLELEATPDRDAAKKVATWFVDAVLSTCTFTEDD